MLSDHVTLLKDIDFLHHVSLMERFDIGLDGEEIKALPDFDDLPAKPCKKKIHQRKSTTKKERDYLIKIQGLSPDELVSVC